MGMFGDYRALQKQTKAMAKTHDVRADFSTMQSKLEALNATFPPIASSRALLHGAPGTASILAMRAGRTMINFESVCELDLLVVLPGRPPIPVTTTATVATAYLQRAVPGSIVSVRMMENDPTDVYIDWSVL